MMKLDVGEDFSAVFQDVMVTEFKKSGLGDVSDAWCSPRSEMEHMVGSVIVNESIYIAICGSVKLTDWTTNFDAAPVIDPSFNAVNPNIKVHSGMVAKVRGLFGAYVNPSQ